MRDAYRAYSALDAQSLLEALARELDKTHPGAAGMVEAGKQFRRVNGHLHLQTLRATLQSETAETVRPTCNNETVTAA